MRFEIQKLLQERHDFGKFIRENPIWYRLLSRNPERIFEIEQAAKLYYGKTFPQKIDRLHQQVQLAQMLMGIMHGMANEQKNEMGD
ncbi:YlbE-like family protein [Calidifontibacillus oryziterrae]|uniref:YlbE-like family protein n=1 Tax=Calidifontibacillus oryziterrae TaxID=1191699 RepID=UPI0002ED29AB|nr:YlbE-like family protein [Calidifontibacillus oryziterrae]